MTPRAAPAPVVYLLSDRMALGRARHTAEMSSPDSSDSSLLIETAAGVLDERDVIVVHGPDAASYLHGQLSQNVQRLGVGESAWSLLLAPQGRIDAWHRITRRADETFWLDMDPGAGAGALERLERFKLRTNASFELTVMPRVALRGPGLPEIGSTDEIAAIAFDWPGISGIDLLGHDAELPAGIPEASSEALLALEIAHGIPAMGAELGEKTIPAEAEIVDRSVDFTKGCYVGQELVARVDSRGNNTPRKVRLLRMQGGAVPLAGAAVTLDGAAVGSITRAAVAAGGEVVALASISRGNEPPLDVAVDVAGGQTPAQMVTFEGA